MKTTTDELGEVVAERQVEAIAKDGSSTPVLLRIGRPLPDSTPEGNGEDWYCPGQILGLGDEAVDPVFGVDSLQALLLCVHSLQLKLADRAKAASVRLDWMEQPDLGLKVDPEIHKLLPPNAPESTL